MSDSCVPEHGRPQTPVVIVGFGAVGRYVCRFLLSQRLRPADVTVLDLKVDQVGLAQDDGFNARYGDATHLDVVQAACEGVARTIVIAVEDDDVTARIVTAARIAVPPARIVAAASAPESEERLRRCGADSVIVPARSVGAMLGRIAACSD